MIDTRLLREELQIVKAQLQKKGYLLDSNRFTGLDTMRKHLQSQAESLQKDRNDIARSIGKAKAENKNCDALLARAESLTIATKEAEDKYRSLALDIKSFLLDIPNIPDNDVPTGNSEEDNLLIKEVGKVSSFDFPAKDHMQILQGIDMKSGAGLSGSRFSVLSGIAAQLHRALSQFMLDVHVHKHGYTEYNLPLLVKPEALEGTGQLPKFSDDIFFLEDHKLALIPTAEVPLTNLLKYSDSKDIPLNLCAHTACFRQEAGSYGKDTKGIFRQHQFEKVELVKITEPDHSDAALLCMLEHATNILDLLELPYRVVSLCGGDLGFSAAKTFDIEVWLPSQGCYREISSCSNTRDFQSRRMGVKMKNSDGKKYFPHTINGSGVAVGRALIAVLENFQTIDGDIVVPEVLKPYLSIR